MSARGAPVEVALSPVFHPSSIFLYGFDLDDRAVDEHAMEMPMPRGLMFEVMYGVKHGDEGEHTATGM